VICTYYRNRKHFTREADFETDEPELPVSVAELQTSSGSGQGTLRGGLTAVGAERSSNGDRVPGDAALVGPLQGGPTIW
jgi:hypothetical protein